MWTVNDMVGIGIGKQKVDINNMIAVIVKFKIDSDIVHANIFVL